jgi:hypothetical protein
MAVSTCPKCDSHRFELKDGTPKNSRFNFSYVQCSSCGALVGVMDYFNVGAETQDIKKQLNNLGSSIDALGRLVETLASQRSRF